MYVRETWHGAKKNRFGRMCVWVDHFRVDMFFAARTAEELGAGSVRQGSGTAGVTRHGKGTPDLSSHGTLWGQWKKVIFVLTRCTQCL